ncbi:glutamate synthase subunit beta [Hydromonas duriensis]|uniref:Glutamate synthase (NADH) small subunit n=1 Tax=Hydromonas duriensis TaxID=1527608 RepID=A0A4R6Y6H7_9BURK|nr:glutamate synthase subunit beta [Hydromonas duriensis]TDR30581.1 glutamate synthase (NADH) small subunit [Hydromonas duriensis]
MGKVTGFLEQARLYPLYEAPENRIKHYKEFVHALSDADASKQGARCMDCGTPFCHNGCPINNIIPDFNDLVYNQDWAEALATLSLTNNFPEFTGRICPAPCEAACTLNINNDPVGIKSIEHAIIDKAWAHHWIKPQKAKKKTGRHVAVIGSGPAGLACAQQLARAGHAVTVYEKNSRIGGLLRYGIPDFKLEKWLIDRRMGQMQDEGVTFKTGVAVACGDFPVGVANGASTVVTVDELKQKYHAVVLAIGSETPRDLPVPGRQLNGVYYALEWLIPQNQTVAGDGDNPINAKGKHVVVIGGGDTGSDCVGTANRHGAASVTQFEVMPRPPEFENKGTDSVWPYWPMKMRTSTSHEEGGERDWSVSTQAFVGKNGQVEKLQCVRVEFKGGKMQEIAGSEFDVKADLVLLAMGFVHPAQNVLDAFGVERDARHNASATHVGEHAYRTNIDKVFVAGDVRRGQSLVVWAIKEGRQAAHYVDAALMGESNLPL